MSAPKGPVMRTDNEIAVNAEGTPDLHDGAGERSKEAGGPEWPQQKLQDMQARISVLRKNREKSAAEFAAMPQGNAHLTQRRQGLLAWHGAASSYFNACDDFTAQNGKGAADAQAAARGNTDFAVAVLDEAEECYQRIFAAADALKVDRRHVTPSRSRFVNMQRLVKQKNPREAELIRDRFAHCGLPCTGFETEDDPWRGGGTVGPTETVEWRYFSVGLVLLAAALGFGGWGFHLANLTPDQRLILLWILPLASGFGAGAFAGGISAKARGLIPGVIITATGGFAVWLLTYLLLPDPAKEADQKRLKIANIRIVNDTSGAEGRLVDTDELRLIWNPSGDAVDVSVGLENPRSRQVSVLKRVRSSEGEIRFAPDEYKSVLQNRNPGSQNMVRVLVRGPEQSFISDEYQLAVGITIKSWRIDKERSLYVTALIDGTTEALPHYFWKGELAYRLKSSRNWEIDPLEFRNPYTNLVLGKYEDIDWGTLTVRYLGPAEPQLIRREMDQFAPAR
jgi:hypothetical protein